MNTLKACWVCTCMIGTNQEQKTITLFNLISQGIMENVNT